MSTQASFVDFVAEQAGLGPRLTWKRMFGEYGLYIDGTVVAFACDDSLFVKPTDATAALTADLPWRPPYSVAKPFPVADELLDEPDRLRALLLATFAAVPAAKAAKAAKPKSGVPKAKAAKVAVAKPKAAKAAAQESKAATSKVPRAKAAKATEATAPKSKAATAPKASRSKSQAPAVRRPKR